MMSLVAAAAVVSLAAYLLAWILVVATVVRQRIVPAASAPLAAPRGVSILKPLCGHDEELAENLRSFFHLAHEPLQLVFGVACAADPALRLVQRLARRYPGRDVAIVVGADASIANPKVALMESLLRHARYEIILLSDSNVRIGRDDVKEVLPAFDDPAVGMVYQPVVAVGERTLPAAVENMHYTEYACFLTVGARVLAGQHTVNAKGQWVRREALAAVDDFARVRDRGADDYELSRQMRAAGWTVAAARIPVRVVQRDWGWTQLASRNLRHAGLRLRICPWAYPLELLFNPIPWTLPLVAAGADWWWTAAAVTGAKVALESSAARLLRGGPVPLRFAAAIPLKDLFYCGCWFVAAFIRTATWRGRTYRLLPGGRIAPLDGASAMPVPEALGSAA